MKLSNSIYSNIGPLDRLDFQNNGTERIKGSFPHLITDPQQIITHLKKESVDLLKRSNVKASRLCSRYFLTEKALNTLEDKVNNLKILHLIIKVEVKIPLGKIFKEDNIDENIWWVWVGGNSEERKLTPKMSKFLKQKFFDPKNFTSSYESNILPKNYKIVLLGTKKRLTKLNFDQIPNVIRIEEISTNYSNQIAQLFSKRFHIYLTPNNDPKYITDTIASCPKTFLLAAINIPKKRIDAIISNEFTEYPVEIKPKIIKLIKICESNDWVKRKKIKFPIFPLLLGISLKQAIKQKPIAIEAECVLEAVSRAYKSGFQGAGLLEKHSRIVTDKKNKEIKENFTQIENKFNTLFLFYIFRLSPSWNFWKNYKEISSTKTTQK